MLKITLLSIIAITLFLFASVHLIWFLVWLLGKLFHFTSSYAPWKWTAIGLVLVAWIGVGYGFFIGRFKLDVNRVDFAHEKVPSSFDGYRIVHISDFHLSTFFDRYSALQTFVDSINAQEPDLICFTGDLVSMGVGEASPCTKILNGLKAKDGIVSVLGNHDFFIYRKDLKDWPQRMAAVEELAKYQREELGWRLLRNDNIQITRGEDTLSVMGVDNHSCKGEGFKTVAFGVLSKAMYQTSGFRLLMSHDPSHWKAEIVDQNDIPLTLSGHTHDAQLRILGWSPASLMFEEHAGLYTKQTKFGSQSIYVNSGLGCTLPVRIGANAEITVIELKRP